MSNARERINKVFGIHSPSKETITAFAWKEPKATEAKDLPKDEWIWVDGYKGTDKDMCCQGYQYEMNKCHDMDCADEEIKVCNKGFHLCIEFADVLRYYPIGGGNRYFKVKALVRKSEYNHYYDYMNRHGSYKLAAKSIIFVSELQEDVLFDVLDYYDSDFANIPDEYKKLALEKDPKTAMSSYYETELLKYGYSEPFATYLVNYGSRNVIQKAIAFGSQEGLSMDVKVMMIFLEK